MAKLGRRADALTGLEAQAAAKAHTFSGAHISNAMWALAKLERTNVDLVRVLMAQAAAKPDALSGSNVANMTWAVATMGVVDEDVLSTTNPLIAVVRKVALSAQ